ncbi:MAG: 30S ribosomal protein S6 [Bacillota bacterium]|nr:30S ribosomal protein S6 [Bacillota bacterium]
MRKYETLIILRNTLEDADRDALIERFKGVIEKDGTVTKVDQWGVKKLAYEIEKLKEGFYVLYEFEATPSLPKELERNLRINDNVLRYMTVSRD